ncbi:hypothetical protein Tco_0818022 [Tanacetum coccineum]
MARMGRNADIKDGVSVKYIMGEPLSPDRVFDFPADEQSRIHVYDFCMAFGQLPGMLAMVGSDIAMLFGDDDFEDDDSEGFDDEEVWEVNEEWLIAPVTPPPMPAVPPSSVYEVGGPSTADAEGQPFTLLAPGLLVPPSVIEDLSTCLGNLEYGHGQLVTKVIQVSDVEVAAGISIREIGLRVFAIEGQVQVMASHMVHAADRFKQIGTQVEQGQQTVAQRDEAIAGLTHRESTLMQCILGMNKRLVDLERRPSGPQ